MGENFTLADYAAMEAAKRALHKAKRGRGMDSEVFEAMAEHEYKKLTSEIGKETNDHQ